MATDNKGNTASMRTAAIGGGIIAILLMVVGAGALIAILAGLAIFAIGLFLLPRKTADAATKTAVTTPDEPAPDKVSQPEASSVAEAMPSGSDTAQETQVADVETAEVEPVAQEEAEQTATASGLIKASKELPGQQELAARKGTWRFEGNASSA